MPDKRAFQAPAKELQELRKALEEYWRQRPAGSDEWWSSRPLHLVPIFGRYAAGVFEAHAKHLHAAREDGEARELWGSLFRVYGPTLQHILPSEPQQAAQVAQQEPQNEAEVRDAIQKGREETQRLEAIIQFSESIEEYHGRQEGGFAPALGKLVGRYAESGQWEKSIRLSWQMALSTEPGPQPVHHPFLYALRHPANRDEFKRRILPYLKQRCDLLSGESQAPVPAAFAQPQRAEETAPVTEGAGVVERQPATVAKDGSTTGRRALKWKDVNIRFLSDLRVQVKTPDKDETFNYAELGFADRRRGKSKADKPKLAWRMLQRLAESGGTIRAPKKDGGWPQVEKQVQELRKVLRRHFCIRTDPVPFVRGGYEAAFEITLDAAYQT